MRAHDVGGGGSEEEEGGRLSRQNSRNRRHFSYLSK